MKARNADIPLVTIYTDGECKGNPGPGGWAYVMMFQGKKKQGCGGSKHTTNNQMELQAIIEGLSSLKVRCKVAVYTDSQYVVNAFNKHWIDNWMTNGWKTVNGSDVKNVDKFMILHKLTQKHIVDFRWIKGHANNAVNNLCDKLAVEQSLKFASEVDKHWT